jgi:hypothetical protein
MSLPESPVAPHPWLKNKEWAAREIRCGPPIRGFVLVLAYLFFGALTLPVVFLDARNSTSSGWFMPVFMVSLLASVLGYLTFIWLRHWKSGDSICRLITLPGVVGGWFKADVECKLPPDSSGAVRIQLINIVGAGRSSSEVWRMEQTVASDLIAAGGAGRSIIRVRLRIRRAPGQEPIPLERGLLGPNVIWRLDIRKKTGGIDFLARFPVPIYDIPDAPESEQLPD